jgi:hypothetical protein
MSPRGSGCVHVRYRNYRRSVRCTCASPPRAHLDLLACLIRQRLQRPHRAFVKSSHSSSRSFSFYFTTIQPFVSLSLAPISSSDLSLLENYSKLVCLRGAREAGGGDSVLKYSVDSASMLRKWLTTSEFRQRRGNLSCDRKPKEGGMYVMGHFLKQQPIHMYWEDKINIKYSDQSYIIFLMYLLYLRTLSSIK